MPKKQKKITLEDLALKIDKVDKGIRQDLGTKINRLDTKIDKFDKNIRQDLGAKIDKVDTKIDKVDKNLKKYFKETLEIEMEKLARMTNKGFNDTQAEFRKEIKNALDTMEKNSIREVKTSELNLKDHIQDKTADISGESVLRDRKLDKKINLINQGLEKKEAVEENIISQVKNIRIFPQITKE